METVTVFVGAVEGSALALAALCESGHAPALVVTLPLERAGAHSDFADLGPLAARHGVPVHRTARTSAPETQDAIRAQRLRLGVHRRSRASRIR